jgi:hypothetical protein
VGKQRDIYKARKKALNALDAIFNPAEHTLVIHYSCESFYDRANPRSPRVTSIAIRNLESGQTKSFSIHLVAERRGVLDDMEAEYDALEREMLEDFFSIVREKQHCRWLHWNMRDANYGFEALENRLRALGGNPAAVVPEEKRVDLSRMLISIYGVGYIAHPRIENLMRANNITPKDFLTGKEEAAIFDAKQFVKLHQSTLRKVDVLANFAARANAGDLKTLASWWELHGGSLKALAEWAREHWLVGAVVTAIGIAWNLADVWPKLVALMRLN